MRDQSLLKGYRKVKPKTTTTTNRQKHEFKHYIRFLIHERAIYKAPIVKTTVKTKRNKFYLTESGVEAGFTLLSSLVYVQLDLHRKFST